MDYRVLVPIDTNEERALAQVQTAASLPGADRELEVTLLHVFTDGEAGDGTSIRDLSAGERAIEELERRGVAVETMIRFDDPAEDILTAADDIDADQIIVGGRKRSPLGSVLFGSISQAVILDADRPVTVTGDSSPEQPTHICQSCGERYYTRDSSEIATCRACGGTKVERVAQA